MNDEQSRMKRDMGGGFIADVITKIRLVIKLIQDDRIDILIKAIPFACLVYLIVPIDLIIGPIDDALVLYLGMDLFINLCPEDIVNEHLEELKGNNSPNVNEDVIDAEFKEK